MLPLMMWYLMEQMAEALHWHGITAAIMDFRLGEGVQGYGFLRSKCLFAGTGGIIACGTLVRHQIEQRLGRVYC